jgi:hypothetical protein
LLLPLLELGLRKAEDLLRGIERDHHRGDDSRPFLAAGLLLPGLFFLAMKRVGDHDQTNGTMFARIHDFAHHGRERRRIVLALRQERA